MCQETINYAMGVRRDPEKFANALAETGGNKNAANKMIGVKNYNPRMPLQVRKKLDEFFPDEFYGNNFGKLFKAGKIETFKIPRDLTQEQIDEIKSTVERFGGGWLGVQATPTGKTVMMFMPDTQAIAKALDMMNRLRGAYAADKIEVSTPATITGMRIIDVSRQRLEDARNLEEMMEEESLRTLDEDNI